MLSGLEDSRAFAVKAVVIGAVTLLHLLVILHFAAAAMRIDFTPIKEVELILGCLGILTCVIAWAFKK